MPSAAEKTQFSEAFMEDGTIVGCPGRGMFTVRAGNRLVDARRATGCLVEPEEGDRVLLAWVGDDRFILSVLAREPGASSRLSVDGDLELRVPAGRFVVASQEGIDLTTAADTNVTAGRLSVNAVEGKVFVQALTALGDRLDAEWSRVKVVAERLHQKVARSYRFVTEMDQLRAAHLDYRAEQTARVHSHNAVITADEVIKLDGKQVHIG